MSECPRCKVLEKKIQQFEHQNAILNQQNAKLEQRIDDLESRLNQNSSNSHRPPSSDDMNRAQKRQQQREERKDKKRASRKGISRMLKPVEEMDHVLDVKPEQCQHCQSELKGTDPSPHRHQVVDIPPITPEWTEYRLHTLRCPRCKKKTKALWPEGVPQRSFGTRIQALVALFGGNYRLSKRNIKGLFQDTFGLKLSLGSISELESDTSDTLQKPVDELQTYLQSQSQIHVDETSWKENHQNQWLWTMTTEAGAFFLIRNSRAGEVAKELIGQCFEGIATTDRWGGYNWLPDNQRALCWAHLLRDFRKLQLREETRFLGKVLEKQTHSLFHYWHRVRDGTMTWKSFVIYAQYIRTTMKIYLKDKATQKGLVGKCCRNLLKCEDSMWAFLREDGLALTNNAAERALRPAVIWRKTSFGTQSERGSRFVERMLSTVTTLRLQGRNVLEYLTSACQAALLGQPAPSLLPTT